MAKDLSIAADTTAADERSQQAAGNMHYYGIARMQSGHLSAVFMAADGVRFYNFETLLENGPFDYMSSNAQREARIGLIHLSRARNKVEDGLATLNDYEPQEAAGRHAVALAQTMRPYWGDLK